MKPKKIAIIPSIMHIQLIFSIILAFQASSSLAQPLAEQLAMEADKFYSSGQIDSFYHYSDKASDLYFKSQNIKKYILLNLKVVQILNGQQKYFQAIDVLDKVEKRIINQDDSTSWGHFAAFFMQKGYAEHSANLHLASIKSYDNSIEFYKKINEKQKVYDVGINPYCINPLNSSSYIAYPQNRSRLLLADPQSVIDALPSKYLNFLKDSLVQAYKKTPESKNFDPLSKLYGQLSEAHLRIQDTIEAYKISKDRYELPKLGVEEKILAKITYANSLHLHPEIPKGTDEARILLNDAIEETNQSDLSPNSKRSLVADALRFRAYLERDVGLWDLARKKAEEGLFIKRSMTSKTDTLLHRDFVGFYLLLGRIYQEQNHFEISRNYFELAINCLVNKAPENIASRNFQELLPSFHLAQTYKLLGNLYFEEFTSNKNYALLDSAVHKFRSMVNIEDRLKALNITPSSRTLISIRRADYLNNAVKACYLLYEKSLEDKYFKDALFFMEKNRAQELQITLAQDAAIKALNLPQDLQNEVNAAWLDLNNLIRIHDSLNYIKPVQSEKLISTKTRLEILQRNYEDLRRQLADTLNTLAPQYLRWLRESQTIALEDLKKSLGSKSVMVSFFEGREYLYIQYIGKHKLNFRRIKLSESFLHDLSTLRKFLKNPEPDEPQIKEYLCLGYDLYNKLLSTNLSAWEIEEIICIPSPLFHDVPLEILLKEKRKFESGDLYRDLPYLWRDYAIRYQFYAKSEIKPLIKNKDDFLYHYLGYAPDYSKLGSSLKDPSRSGYQNLLFNRQEISITKDIMAQVGKSQTYLDFEANKASFISTSPEARILHLAMHADTDSSNSVFSHLVFGKSPQNTNVSFGQIDKMYSYEILPIPFSLDLTILSACKTGTGIKQKGEGIMSLGRAFTYAGSRSIIQSLWEVDDLASQKFVPEFMEGIRAGLTKAEALREVKEIYLRDNLNPKTSIPPFYWAQFVIYGDNSAVSGPDLDVNYLFLLLFLSFPVLIYFWLRRYNLVA